MWNLGDADQIDVDLVRESGTHDANGNRYTLNEYREYHTWRAKPGGNSRAQGRAYLKTSDDRDVLPLGKGRYRILVDPPIEVVADE
jgi:hypothetical protein